MNSMHVETWAIFDHFWVIFGHLRVISMFGARVWEYLSESIHSRSMFRLSTIFNDSLHLHWGLLNVHRRVWRSPRRWWAKHVGISRISLCFPTWCLMISCFSPCFIMFYYIFLCFIMFYCPSFLDTREMKEMCPTPKCLMFSTCSGFS